MKKAFSALVIASAGLYVFGLYQVLFAGANREMIVMSESMLEHYNYWNSVNLVPLKTIAEYITAIIDGSIRGVAIRNLFGNLLLFFPMGFYLPFFVKKLAKIKPYSLLMAVVIILVEVVQLATKSGSLDIDDFLLNFAGALMGFLLFTRTPARAWLKLRAW